MRYEIFKSASEIKLAKKVNEYLAAGATVIGFPQIGVEKTFIEGTKRKKNVQMFYQAILIPEGVQNIDLGNDVEEQILPYFAEHG